MTVIADTSPLNYLILIGESEVLPHLYGRFLISGAVHDERAHARAPQPVRRWLAQAPAWLERVEQDGTPGADAFPGLDGGQAEAIALALTRGIGLVRLDERQGRVTATAQGLRVTGRSAC